MDYMDRRYRIPVPGVQQPVGSGDLVKRIANFLGLGKKPCGGCEQRQARMNAHLYFGPPDRFRQR